jgi:hypothetical protein
LQDNHGRLFSTPLINVNLYATSSNSDIASINIINHNSQIELVGNQKGSCVINVGIQNRNIYDTVVVTVGSQLLPDYESSVLVDGKIQFSLLLNEDYRWISWNSDICEIDKSGLALGLKVGRCKISNGDVVGWL